MVKVPMVLFFVYKYDIMVVKRIVESAGMIYGLYNDDPNGSLKVSPLFMQ